MQYRSVKLKALLPVLLFTSMLSCTLFPPFEHVEGDKLRVIGATFHPLPEAAPGDTAILRLHFGGNPVVAVDSLKVVWSAVRSFYTGVDTFYSIDAFHPIAVTSFLPDSIEYQFVVPDTVLNKSLTSLGVPLVGGLNLLIGQLSSGGTIDTADSMVKQMITLVNTASQPAYVFCTAISENGTRRKIRSEFSISYKSKFKRIPALSPFIYVNNNPEINWIGVYKVKGKNLPALDPSDRSFAGKDSFQYLYDNGIAGADTILIDTGYSYFFAADSGINKVDSAGVVRIDTTRDFAMIPSVHKPDSLYKAYEDYYYTWMYKDFGNASMPWDSLMVIQNLSAFSIVKMLPSVDTAVHDFRVWVMVDDQLMGVVFRPRGKSIREVSGHFKYTRAYAKAVNH